jgi:hypothetical protein
VTWGNSGNGGDSSAVAASLNGTIDVTSIVSNQNSFAAIRADGSVVTWGDSSYGGDSSAVAASLNSGVTSIARSPFGFAVIKVDGSVVTWGNPSISIWKPFKLTR